MNSTKKKKKRSRYRTCQLFTFTNALVLYPDYALSTLNSKALDWLKALPNLAYSVCSKSSTVTRLEASTQSPQNHPGQYCMYRTGELALLTALFRDFFTSRTGQGTPHHCSKSRYLLLSGLDLALISTPLGLVRTSAVLYLPWQSFVRPCASLLPLEPCYVRIGHQPLLYFSLSLLCCPSSSSFCPIAQSGLQLPLEDKEKGTLYPD